MTWGSLNTLQSPFFGIIHSPKMSYFPAFLDIRDRKCVVVGGGNVAAQKVRALLRYEASVCVVAAELYPALKKLARAGAIRWIARNFVAGDLRGSFLAIAATDDAAVNQSVWREACKRRIWANVVDDPAHCHFIVPSIFRRGRLQVAVSTGGASPAMAKIIRKTLGETFGPEYATALNWMGTARLQVARRVRTFSRRKALFSALAATDIPGGIKKYGRAAAKRNFDRVLKNLLSKFGKN